MKYFAKELLSGPKNLDNVRDLELRECTSADEATKFVQEIMNKNLELRLKRQKKDYDKIILVELYFERPKADDDE